MANAKEESVAGELKRRRIALQDDLAHGRLEFEGFSEVAADDLPEIVAVWH